MSVFTWDAGSGGWAGGATDAELATHEADTTSVHGISDTALLAPARNGLAPTAAAQETFPRSNITNQCNTDTLQGYLLMSAIYLPAGQTVSNITLVNGTAGLTSPTHQLFGLYSDARALLATSADDTTTAWAAYAAKTLAMTVPYVVPTSGLYYIGYTYTGTAGQRLSSAIHNGVYGAHNLTPKLCGWSDSGLSTALPNPASVIDGTRDYRFYAYTS